MFDLHGHYLPGLDDGAQNWEESLAMAKRAADDGIEGVVCTPHWMRGSFENGRPRILKALRQFKEKLKQHQVPLQVFPGAELRLDFDLLRWIREREVLTLNDMGRYVLIELPSEVLPRRLDHFFWNFQSLDMIVIISHPERNLALLKDPARLFRWAEMGILTQITASSLLGGFGPAIQRFACTLLEHRLTQFIATDTHGMHTRPPLLSAARKAAETVVGPELAHWLVDDYPKRIIAGETINPPEPIPIKGQKSSSSFWERCRSAFRRSYRRNP